MYRSYVLLMLCFSYFLWLDAETLQNYVVVVAIGVVVVVNVIFG